MPVFLYVLVSATISVTQYIAVTFIPVTSAHSVIITAALSSGLVLFTMVTQEKMRIDRLLAVLVFITGVLLVLQPAFLFNNLDEQSRHTNVAIDANVTLNKNVPIMR